MRRASPANISLLLALISILSLLCWLSLVSGQAEPSLAAEKARQFQGSVLVCLALAALPPAIWLSGYSFPAAPKRSAIAMLLALAPFATMCILWFT